MYCKHCGKQIDNDSVFCKHCGGVQGDNKSDAIQKVKEESPIQIEISSPRKHYGRIKISKTSVADGLAIFSKELLINILIACTVICIPIILLAIVGDEPGSDFGLVVGIISFLIIMGRYIFKLSKWVKKYRSK